MTLPQSGRLDGGEQPQGLPDERAQRLLDVTVFIPALGIELLLVANITANVLFFTSHRGDRITSRPEGFAVEIALAPPTLPSHCNRGFPLDRADDFGHRVFRWDADQHVDVILPHVAFKNFTPALSRQVVKHRPHKLPPFAIEFLLAPLGHKHNEARSHISGQVSRPTVCPSVASRNLLLYQSLPISILYRYALG